MLFVLWNVKWSKWNWRKNNSERPVDALALILEKVNHSLTDSLTASNQEMLAHLIIMEEQKIFWGLQNTRRRRTIFGKEKYFRKENICGWIA